MQNIFFTHAFLTLFLLFLGWNMTVISLLITYQAQVLTTVTSLQTERDDSDYYALPSDSFMTTSLKVKCVFGAPLVFLKKWGHMRQGVPVVLLQMVEFLEQYGKRSSVFDWALLWIVSFELLNICWDYVYYVNLCICVCVLGLHHRELFCASGSETRRELSWRKVWMVASFSLFAAMMFMLWPLCWFFLERTALWTHPMVECQMALECLYKYVHTPEYICLPIKCVLNLYSIMQKPKGRFWTSSVQRRSWRVLHPNL